MAFLERAALWAGGVGRRALVGHFGVSLNHATNDFAAYRELAPENLSYDIVEQRYRITGEFTPRFIAQDAGEFLGEVLATAGCSPGERQLKLGFELPFASVPSLGGRVDGEMLGVVTRAISGKGGVLTEYQSLQSASVVKRRFWPSALAFTGYRWLIRGWDSKNGAWIDLALARMLSAAPIADPLPEEVAEDTAWHCEELLLLAPNPALSPEQQDIVAREYGMAFDGGKWVLEVPVRRALIAYVLDYYGLRPDAPRPGVRSLALLNEQDILAYDRASAFGRD